MPKAPSAKRYAQAVFAIASETGQLEEWADCLQRLSGLVSDEELKRLLADSRIPLQFRVDSLKNTVPDLLPLAYNFMGVVMSRGLVDIVPAVGREYLRLVDVYLGRQRVRVTSAVLLEDQEKERVMQFLAEQVGKGIVLDTQVDPQMLGGLVILVGDTLIDGSTRNKLEQLRKTLVDSRV